jgi:zinc protease
MNKSTIKCSEWPDKSAVPHPFHSIIVEWVGSISRAILAMKGTGFSPYINRQKSICALQATDKLDEGGAMSQGTTLVVPIRPTKWTGLQPLRDVFLNTSHQILPFLRPASVPAMKGTGFSPYINRQKSIWALAPEAKQISKSLIAIAFLAALVTTSLPAQQAKPWEKIPIPKLHEFKPQQPKRIELQNGIVIFLQEDHELPFIYGSVLIPGGSRDTEPAKAGLTDIYALAWRTSGSAKMDGDAMDDLLESKAAHIETNADEDSTAVSWDSLKGDSDQVYSLAMDLLFHPSFKADKLTIALQQEAAGIVRRNDDETQIADRESAKLVYGKDSPYTRQAEIATIGKVTLNDLKTWHDVTLAGKLIIGVGGDFDPAAMEAKLRATFESLPPAKSLGPRHDVLSAPAHAVSFIDKTDVNQSNIQIVGDGIDRHSPDVPAVAVMDEVLGGGFASRLFQEVRTRLGLAYAVGGGLNFPWDHPGEFQVEALTKSSSTVEATKAAMDVIQSLTTRPVTEEELARAKDNILNSFLFTYDTREKVLQAREELEFYGYPADYLETYHKALEDVTLADVNRVATKYIQPARMGILVVGNKSEIKPPLEDLKLGPVHPVDITIPGIPAEKPEGAAAN